MFYSGLGALTTYNLLQKNGDQAVQRYTSQRTVNRDIEQFKERIAKIDSPEELLKDRRALQFVLTSFQLESELDKTGVLRKLLTEDPKSTKSLAARMVDPRYQNLANTLAGKMQNAFKGEGLQKIIDNYVTNTFEKSAGENNPGLREALYFKRNIAKATTVSQIMSDRVLSFVVRGGMGLPEQFSLQPFEKQKAFLDKRLNLDQFKDPVQVEKFVRRFLALNSIQTGGQAASSNPALQLLSGAANGGGGISLLA